MSANLCWRPIDKKHKTLPDALKFVLRDKRGLDEGRQIWGAGEIPYLTGLVHAGVEGASELIEAIEKYEEVELWLEY